MPGMKGIIHFFPMFPFDAPESTRDSGLIPGSKYGKVVAGSAFDKFED